MKLQLVAVLELTAFSANLIAELNDLILSKEGNFEILLTPTELTHYDPLKQDSVVQKGGISGIAKIKKEGSEFTFCTRAASQSDFELRSKAVLIKEESSVYSHFGESVKITFLVENKIEDRIWTSVHVLHFMKIDGAEFYTYYNSLKNIIYKGEFEIINQSGANQPEVATP